MKNKILYWAPRILSILIITFFALFILEGFSPGFGWRDSVMALLITLVAIVATVISWKRPNIGGWLFILFGIFWVIMLHTRLLNCLVIGGMPIITGILFLLEKNNNINNQNQECCPKFNPEPWDNRIIEWDNKKFIKANVFTLFFMPINFGQVITKLMAKADKTGTKTPDNLCLSYHTSKWNMEIYLAVDKEVPDAENLTLSGRFFSKAYEGDFKETGKWCKDFEKSAKSKGYEIKKWYMWYTTCPTCAKKYGKNYTVIIGKID